MMMMMNDDDDNDDDDDDDDEDDDDDYDDDDKYGDENVILYIYHQIESKFRCCELSSGAFLRPQICCTIQNAAPNKMMTPMVP